MERLIIITLLFNITIFAKQAPTFLEKNCLNCHLEQKIPSELIYRRYLLEYSTTERIKEQLLSYLKKPTKESSIMPKQFFLKFPEKKALDLNTSTLEESTQAYLDYFDVKKILILDN